MPKFPGRYDFFSKTRPPQGRHFSPPLQYPREGVVSQAQVLRIASIVEPLLFPGAGFDMLETPKWKPLIGYLFPL